MERHNFSRKEILIASIAKTLSKKQEGIKRCLLTLAEGNVLISAVQLVDEGYQKSRSVSEQ